MKFNLAKLKADNIIIANTDDVFAGTELAEEGFTVEVKRLTRAEKIDVSSNALDENGNVSQGEYSKAMFVSSIVAVGGFTDENGEEITIEKHVRELIWEYSPDQLVDEIRKAIESYRLVDEKKSELLESDLVDTPNMQ